MREAMQRDLAQEQCQRKMEETKERKIKAVYCDTVCLYITILAAGLHPLSKHAGYGPRYSPSSLSCPCYGADNCYSSTLRCQIRESMRAKSLSFRCASTWLPW
jgi:hypothetical protein